VSESVPRLTSLLRANGVSVETDARTKPAPLASAWTAFRQFAALRVSQNDLENDPMADAFLFEVGTYDSSAKWGRTLEVSFVRQYGMKDGDLQQVHLIAHFRPRAFDEIRSQIRVSSCAPHVPGCVALCSYAGRNQLTGSPCRIVAGSTARAADRKLDDVSAWSFDTGVAAREAQRRSWIAFVDSSPLLLRTLASKELLGYEVRQESVE
jgi:hypothetical protein